MAKECGLAIMEEGPETVVGHESRPDWLINASHAVVWSGVALLLLYCYCYVWRSVYRERCRPCSGLVSERRKQRGKDDNDFKAATREIFFS